MFPSFVYVRPVCGPTPLLARLRSELCVLGQPVLGTERAPYAPAEVTALSGTPASRCCAFGNVVRGKVHALLGDSVQTVARR